jgi:indolepyruvate ferredoxin oxidoreductase alpha subunit
VLCAGCPHIDSYLFLKEVMAAHPGGRVFSDIGCYTLGALPPFEAISSCVDMGASITMAKGAADAGVHPAVAVIGDSTFTHSGLTGLLDAVHENTHMTVLILDNGTTGMTGGQTSMGTGRMPEIVKGLGVPAEHIHTVVPLRKNHAENVAVLQRAVAYRGVSVIIALRACIQTAKK